MGELAYTDKRLAELYNLLNPWGPCDNFYLEFVMAEESVLDVGCGTGTLLHRARESGHTGRLCGLDPAAGMLDQARRRTDIEWVQYVIQDATWNHEFDLVVMTGHAFQVLIEDDDVRAALAAIRNALVAGGRFVFETRNPRARAWESWAREDATVITANDGTTVRVEYGVEMPVVGDVVHLTETFINPAWGEPHVDRGSLRFLDEDTLGAFLKEAGFVIEAQFGDWSRNPIAPESPEIITVASRR